MEIKSFVKSFGKPELKSIINNWSSLLLILVVSYLSLWSMGFSRASRTYLSDKMNSPFVEYLSIELEYRLARDDDFMKSLTDKLDSKQVQSDFGIERYDFVSLHSPYFFMASGNGIDHSSRDKLSLAQITSTDDPFLKFVRDPKNKLMISGNPDMDKNPWSVMVTADFLEDKLNFDISNSTFPSYIHLDLDQVNGEKSGFPLAISGVVKRLPNNVDLLIKPDLFKALTSPSQSQNPLWMNHPNYKGKENYYFELKDIKDTTGFRKIMNQEPMIQMDSITHKYPGDGYFINCADSVRAEEILKKLSLLKSDLLKTYNPQDVTFITQASRKKSDVEHLVVKMNDLTKVEAFEKFCKNEGISIDMSDIEDRNNFQLFSSLSRILSGFLSFICIVFMITILSRTIIQHLDKNSKNLGTLKAFGLSNRNIIITYSLISTVIILAVFHSSFLLAELLGSMTSGFITSLFPGDVPVLFDLPLNMELYLYFVVVPITVISITLYNRIRKVTPGDLIYERD